MTIDELEEKCGAMKKYCDRWMRYGEVSFVMSLMLFFCFLASFAFSVCVAIVVSVLMVSCILFSRFTDMRVEKKLKEWENVLSRFKEENGL